MIPYDVDPSLHGHEPGDFVLDDGFAPRAVATHPVEPEPTHPEPGAPNPTHLPVEPEFAPQVPPSDAEKPQPGPPDI